MEKDILVVFIMLMFAVVGTAVILGVFALIGYAGGAILGLVDRVKNKE